MMFIQKRTAFENRARLIMVVAFGAWLGIVGTIIYVAAHFIAKPW